MKIVQQYGFAGVLGLLAAIAVNAWLGQPDPGANLMVFAVTFALVAGAAQALWSVLPGRKQADKQDAKQEDSGD